MAKLYETIVNKIMDSILKGELKENDKLPTEVVLAEEFGVSRITSKRALEELRIQGYIYRIQGSGSFVSPVAGKDKRELGKPGKSRRIAFVLPFDKSLGGMINAINGASAYLNEHDYHLTIHSNHRDLEAERDLLDRLYREGADGIIFYPISDIRNFEIINKLYFNNFPIVTIDKYFEGVPISSVVSDNQESMLEATEALIAGGHKKIAFISDEPIEIAHSIRQRYFGYCRALKEAGLPINDSIAKLGCLNGVEELNFSQRYRNIVADLMDQKISALICINDIVASQIMREALNLGIRIPEDLSIVGYDDIELASHLQVPLTTVAQDFNEMGRIAAELVLENSGNEHESRQIVLPSKLVIRDSTKLS